MASGSERGRGEAQDATGDDSRGRTGQGALMAPSQAPAAHSNAVSRGRKEVDGVVIRGGHKGKDGGSGGSEKERRKRSEGGNSFRIEQFMPEDDINAAVAQLTTDADLIRMHQHLESIQSYSKHQHARIDRHLATVRTKLQEKGTDPKGLPGITSIALTIPSRLTSVPRGISDEVMMEAYRASKKLEYEIRTKWDGLQVDLTSGYPSTVTARPAPPRIVDRNFEEGEVVQNRDRKEKSSKRERRQHSPSRSRSRSRSQNRARKKSRRYSPRVKRKSRSRSRTRSPRRFPSKSRSPIRYRKHPSPSSDGSFQKAIRARSRSWSRGRGKGKSKEKDPREAGRDQQAGVSETRTTSFADNRQKVMDSGSLATSHGMAGEKTLPAQTPAVEGSGKGTSGLGKKEPPKQMVQRTKQKDAVGPNSAKMVPKTKAAQVADRRVGSTQQTAAVPSGVPGAVASTPPIVQLTKVPTSEPQKSTAKAGSVAASLRPPLLNQPARSPAAVQSTGNAPSGPSHGVPSALQPQTYNFTVPDKTMAPAPKVAEAPTPGLALQRVSVPPVAAKSKSSIPLSTAQIVVTHAQPGQQISSATSTHPLTAAMSVNPPHAALKQSQLPAQHHGIQGTKGPSPSSTPAPVNELTAVRGVNPQHARMPISSSSSVVSIGQGTVVRGPSHNGRPAGLPWPTAVHQTPQMHQAPTLVYPNPLLSASATLTSTPLQPMVTGIRRGVQNQLPPPPPPCSPPVSSGYNLATTFPMAHQTAWQPVPAMSLPQVSPSSHVMGIQAPKAGSVGQQEQARQAGTAGKNIHVAVKKTGGLPQVQLQAQSQVSAKATPQGQFVNPCQGQDQAQNGNNEEDDSEDDGCTFSHLEPAPLPAKTPTLNVFKGPPHLLARSKQLCHNALTMCTPMLRVSGKLGDLREALWKAIPCRKAEKHTAPLSKISQLSDTLTKDLLAFRSLRRNQRVFRMLAGGRATTSTTHWHKIDPWWALCSNETMKGSCDIPQCSYQHMRNMKMTPSEKTQELHQHPSQQSQPNGGLQVTCLWPVSSAVVQRIEKNRGMGLNRVQSMSSCARSIIEGKTSSSQGVCHHAFKSALLSGAVNLEKQGINTQRMQQCLENIHRMKLWKPTSTDADPVINGKFDSRLCEVEETMVNIWDIVDPEDSSLTIKRNKDELFEQLLTFFSQQDRGQDRKAADGKIPLRLWLSFLPLASKIGRGKQLHENGLLNRVVNEHGCCYQIVQWYVALEPDCEKQIKALKAGITNLNKAAQREDFGISGSECTKLIGPCVADMALKVLHLAVSSGEGICEDVKHAISKYENVVPVDDLLGLESDDWMLVTLQVVHRFPIECAVLWLSVVHCLLFGRLPDSVIHCFGHAQRTFKITWDLAAVTPDQLKFARDVFLYATSSKLGGLGKSGKAGDSKQIAAKECLALNILQFDMAMENQAHRGSCPILCEIFPDGPQVKGGKDSNEKWKSMLCNSSWRASCVILGQDDCDEDDDDDSTDGMELDESSPKLEQREDLGASLLVLQGVKLNYQLVKARNESRFWRKHMDLMWQEIEGGDDGMGPFRNLHMQQSLWLTHAMVALEEDAEGPSEAYNILTNGACALKPLSGDVPAELSALKEVPNMNTGDVTSTSEKYRVVTPERAKLCFKILLDPKYREQYCQLWTGLEDGEVMDPECMKWSTEEIAVGWLNCAISQMLGGSSQDVYPCLCLALSSCGDNWPMRLRIWNEILTCVVSILGPTKVSNAADGKGGSQHKNWRVDGRWSGWQMHSVPTEQEHCLPTCDTSAPLDMSCKLMKDRGRTFEVLLELVRKLLHEAQEKDELKGLQLPQVKCADRSLSRRVELEPTVDLSEVVSILGPQLKNLTQGEIVVLFEVVITSCPSSPSMVVLALDVASLLPSRNLAQWWVPLLVNALVSAYPPVSPALWSQSIEVIEAYSKEAAQELKQCQHRYPLEVFSRYCRT